jgi:hypothetical protein
MRIEIIPASGAPSALTERTSRRSGEWDLVAESLLDAKRGDWLRVLLTEAPGRSLKNKQGKLISISAMRIRKLKVTTRTLGAHLSFRVTPDVSG